MQRKIMLLACAFIAALQLVPSLMPKAHGQETVVSYQTFYDELAPYGQWIADPTYGNVWVPNVEPGFRPYGTEGHWAMTEYGNMWVSDAPWGWAAYHYGRWTYNSYYGWVWVPGHEWAPAWVSWRQGGGYYGWAPMPPGYVPGSYYAYPDNYWVFVGPQYLYQPHVYGYYEPRNTTVYISHTTYVNETYVDNDSHVTYCYGPRREVIERESHQTVQVYNVSNASSPGGTRMSNNSVSVYRPAVNSQSVATARPASVITASQPVGKPENYDPGHNHNEFHQQVHNQSPMPQQHPGGQSQQAPAHQQQFAPQQHQPMQTQPMQPQHQPMQTQHQPMPEQHQQPMPQQHQPMPEQHQPMPEQHQPMPEQQHQPMPQQHQQPMQHQQPAPQQHSQQRQAPAPAHEAKKK